MTFDELIECAWNDHADHPEAVADRLAVALASVMAAEQVAPYSRIVAHVTGEHLGQWERGIDLLESLRRKPALADAPAAHDALRRDIATLRYAAGDTAAVTPLAVEDRARVLANAACAMAGRARPDDALAAYAEAVALAPLLPAGSVALRALAIGGNNVATELERMSARTPAQTEGMIAAAQGGLAFWRIAGTWLEEERAQYRLACSLLAAGTPVPAIEAGKTCAQICIDHDAPAFERFFAYAVLARALREARRPVDYADMRAEALAWFERVPQDERCWCEADLAELA